MKERLADRLDVTPERFNLVAKLALLGLALIVLSGAAVRVTGSGLGCPDWPQCYKGSASPFPETDLHALIEFTNRVFSGFVVLISGIAWLLSYVRRPYRRDEDALRLASARRAVKRTALERHMREHGAEFVRQGAGHEKWRGPQGRSSVVPRHWEIGASVARAARACLSS